MDYYDGVEYLAYPCFIICDDDCYYPCTVEILGNDTDDNKSFGWYRGKPFPDWQYDFLGETLYED